MKKAVLPTILLAIFAVQSANAANEGRELLFGPSPSNQKSDQSADSRRVPLFKKDKIGEVVHNSPSTKVQPELKTPLAAATKPSVLAPHPSHNVKHPDAVDSSSLPRVSGPNRVPLFVNNDVHVKSKEVVKSAEAQRRVVPSIVERPNTSITRSAATVKIQKNDIELVPTKSAAVPSDQDKQRIKLFSKVDGASPVGNALTDSKQKNRLDLEKVDVRSSKIIVQAPQAQTVMPTVDSVSIKPNVAVQTPKKNDTAAALSNNGVANRVGMVGSAVIAPAVREASKAIIGDRLVGIVPKEEAVGATLKHVVAAPVEVVSQTRIKNSDLVEVVPAIRILPGQDPYLQREGLLRSVKGAVAVGFQVSDASLNFTSDSTYLPILNAISSKAGVAVVPAYAARTTRLREHIVAKTFPLLQIDPSYFADAKAAGYQQVAMLEAKGVVALLVPVSSKIKSFSGVSSAKIGLDLTYPLSSSIVSVFSDKQNIVIRDSEANSVRLIIKNLMSGEIDALALSMLQAEKVAAASNGALRIVRDDSPQLVFGWWIDREALSPSSASALIGAIEGKLDNTVSDNKTALDRYASGWGITEFSYKKESPGTENAIRNGDKMVPLIRSYRGAMEVNSR